MKKILYILIMFGVFLSPLYSKGKKEEAPPPLKKAEPTASKVDWTPIGPGLGGRILAVAVSPIDNNLIYCSSYGGGLFKSIDGGKTWTPEAVDFLRKNRCLNVYSITFAPSNPNVIYCAGTLKFSDFDGAVLSELGAASASKKAAKGDAGLFKSIDGGKNWQVVPGTLPLLGAFAVDPENADAIWAAGPGFGLDGVTYSHTEREPGDGAVCRSISGGSLWKVSWPGVRDAKDAAKKQIAYGSIVIDPKSPKGQRTIFISGNNGVFRGLDNGAGWEDIGSGLPHKKAERLDINFEPKSNKTFLYVTLDADSDRDGGVFVSDDRGMSWCDVSGNLDKSLGYSWVKCDPSNYKIVYVAQKKPGRGIFKTLDGGLSWKRVNFASGENSNKSEDVWNPETLHSDVADSDIVISRKDHDLIFYADGSGALFKSDDAGESWEQIYCTKNNDAFGHRGISNLTVSDISVAPKQLNSIFMTSPDFGVFVSRDGAKTWTASVLGSDDSGKEENEGVFRAVSLAMDRINPSILCIGIDGSRGKFEGRYFAYTRDSGVTWGFPPKAAGEAESEDKNKTALPDRIDSTPYSISILASGRVMLSNNRGVFYSDNLGVSWSRSEVPLPKDSPYRFFRVYPGTSNPKIVYAICAIPEDTDSGVARPAVKLDQKVSSGMCGGLYISENEGKTWRKLSANLEWANPSCLAFNEDESVMYMGVKAWVNGLKDDRPEVYPGGLYVSTDGGRSWSQTIKCRSCVGAGVTAVAVNPKYQKTVYAAVSEKYNADSISGIYMSIDNGLNWRDISFNAGTPNSWLCLSVSNSEPYLIFAGAKHGGAYIGVDQRIWDIEERKRVGFWGSIWHFFKTGGMK